MVNQQSSVPIWMVCFYAIRAGMQQELIHYLKSYQYSDDDLNNFAEIVTNELQNKQRFS